MIGTHIVRMFGKSRGWAVEIVALLCGAIGIGSLAAPATQPAGSKITAPRAGDWSREDAAHLLRRGGFGGTPEQIDRLHSLGKIAAGDYLLTGQLPADAKAPREPL